MEVREMKWANFSQSNSFFSMGSIDSMENRDSKVFRMIRKCRRRRHFQANPPFLTTDEP